MKSDAKPRPTPARRNLLSKDETFPNKTSSFEWVDGTPLEPSWIDGVAGDGGVFSSIEDFVTWDGFWRGNDLISDSVLAEAFKRPKLSDGTFSDYGFGWVLTDEGAWHNGRWLGACTCISRRLRERDCIVVLDNSSSWIVDEMASELERVIFGQP
ncbi:MAG: serine hydrolase [Planctomycetales bacterium]|nr:serine hydrolase [Planctomycetales bacterium]